MSCALAYLLCCRARCSAERLASALAFFPPEPSYAYELEAATIVQPEAVVAAVQRIVGAAVPA